MPIEDASMLQSIQLIRVFLIFVFVFGTFASQAMLAGQCVLMQHDRPTEASAAISKHACCPSPVSQDSEKDKQPAPRPDCSMVCCYLNAIPIDAQLAIQPIDCMGMVSLVNRLSDTLTIEPPFPPPRA